MVCGKILPNFTCHIWNKLEKIFANLTTFPKNVFPTENDVTKLLLNEEAFKEYAARKHRGKVL